jgi:hypothetical protein
MLLVYVYTLYTHVLQDIYKMQFVGVSRVILTVCDFGVYAPSSKCKPRVRCGSTILIYCKR